LNRKQILVVEDDLDCQRLIKYSLREQFKIHYAVSYKQALAILKKSKIDLLLLDLTLAGSRDGLDLAKNIRKKETLADLPVIVVTAHAFETDRKRVLQAGCDDYMTKPFRPKNLFEKVQTTIGYS